MEKEFREEEFYKDNGWPTESLSYCSYRFYNGNETDVIDTAVCIQTITEPNLFVLCRV